MSKSSGARAPFRALFFLPLCAAACRTNAPEPRESGVTPGLGANAAEGIQLRVLPEFTQDVPACTTPLTFVRIPAATPFWISTTEVPWEAFDAYAYKKDKVAGATNDAVDALTRPTQPYNPMDRGFGHAGYPAISMSFANAKNFCAWLSAHTGKPFRLPTESEWEFAARAGETTPWPGGSAAHVADFAWIADLRTHPVATKRANAFGLFDVIGNAGEWCSAPSEKGATGVMRGATFQSTADEARFDARAPNDPAWNRHDPQIPKSKWWLIDGGFVGFRVVCDDPPSATGR